MQEPKVSLVIPCWHVAHHMQHVLEDLQAQTFTDFEAILVNDGDDSQVAAMEAIAAKDCRIHIVNLKQNSGVAAARNAGTNVVTTEWVGYIDADDRFGPNYLKSLYEAVDGTGVDMACGGFTYYYVKTGKKVNNYFKIGNSSQIVDIATGYKMIGSICTEYHVWNKLYNMQIIQKNKLSQDISIQICQDYAFNMVYFPCIKNMAIVRDCEYEYYVYDSDTVSRRYNPLFMKNSCDIIRLREAFHRQIKWQEQQIIECRNKELAHSSYNMCGNLFLYHSPLTINSATTKIQEEILNQPEIVNAILTRNYGKDRMMRLYKRLVHLGNARMIAIVYKILCIAKIHFRPLADKLRPFYRGE